MRRAAWQRARAETQAQAEGGAALAPPDMYPLFRALAKNRPLLLVRGGISDLIDPAIAERMHRLAALLAVALKRAGIELTTSHFFDTLQVNLGARALGVYQAALAAGMNRPVPGSTGASPIRRLNRFHQLSFSGSACS